MSCVKYIFISFYAFKCSYWKSEDDRHGSRPISSGQHCSRLSPKSLSRGSQPTQWSDTSWNLKAIYAEHSLRPQKALRIAKQRALQTKGFPFASCAHLPLSLWMGIINLSVFLLMKCGWVTARFLTLRPWSPFLPKSPLLFHGSLPGGPGFYNPLQTFTDCWSRLPPK